MSQIDIILAMQVGELGEFGLIELLSHTAPPGDESHRILVGIGDDAAVWRGDDRAVLATTDALVEGVHFTPATPWYDLGWKALVTGLSDVAAMGGLSRYALVALALTDRTEVDDVSRLYAGMAEAAVRFDVAIVGGNISRAAVTVITVTVIGRVEEDRILTRSAARPGDLIAVTGYLGSSAAGMRTLALEPDFSEELRDLLLAAHRRPLPRIACGRHFAAAGVKTAIDISDGLIADLGHVCQSSKVGATVWADRVPVHPKVREAFPHRYLDLALGGGEDYELLFTASPEIMEGATVSWHPPELCPVTIIGETTVGQSITVLREYGQPYVSESKGWDHFRKGE